MAKGFDPRMKRYARHVVLKKIGTEGQVRLLGGKVLVVGAGGLGSPAALYLAAAGVGTIGIADADSVELSNLQRQILYRTDDIGRKKPQSARRILGGFNPDVKVEAYETFLTARNAMDIIGPYDFIVDGTDSAAAKFLINDACVMAKKPFAHAGVGSFYGQITTYVPEKGPCCRCIFGSPDEEGAPPRRGGVVGAACGVIGSLQAMEAIKYIVGVGDLLAGRLLTYDALAAGFRSLTLPPASPDCPACGENPSIVRL
jgi:molybdopterin/thiamine biosynthesis adenylyltransferase